MKKLYLNTKETQIKLWNLILQLCLSDQEKIESFINIKNMYLNKIL